MSRLPSAAEYESIFLDALQRRRPSLNRRDNAAIKHLANALSKMIVRSDEAAVATLADGTLEAEGPALDAYVARRGPVRRFAASKARGVVTLSRATIAAGAGPIPAGLEVRVPYQGRSVVAATRAAGAIGSTATSITLEVEALEAGAEANTGTVVSGLALTGAPAALFDATIRPTSIALSGGSPVESDVELRERQRLWERARQRGTAPAIAYGALTVNGVKRVVLAEMNDAHLGARAIAYVGDRDWNHTTPMLNEVATALEAWRAWGYPIEVRGITSADVAVTAALVMARSLANYNELELMASARSQIDAYFDSRRDPYAYDRTMLSGRIGRANDEISRVILEAPAASVPSPLARGAVWVDGYPTVLTRYRAGVVTLALQGPT